MQRRLAAYSHDTVGLGHLRRTISICRHLADQDPRLSALVLSGSPFAEALGCSDRVDYLKLPSARKIANGQYESRYLDLDFDSLARLRGAVIDEGLKNFDPDLLLVDKTPGGMGGELLPHLTRLRSSRSGTRVVLGLRDILDSPETVREEWRRERLWDVVDEFYDEVWIYGQPDFFDTVREYDFPDRIAARTHYVGYLPKYNGIVPRERLVKEIGLEGRRLVLVTAGGGEDGYPIFDRYLRELDTGPAPKNTFHYLVTGPGMSPVEAAELLRRSVRQDVALIKFSSQMTSLIAAADLVVTMGGYNSLTEILSLSRRAVVVPRTVPRTEQLLRAERLAARGLVRIVRPDGTGPGGLLAAVVEELESPPARDAVPLQFDGLREISRRVSRLIDPEPHPKVLQLP